MTKGIPPREPVKSLRDHVLTRDELCEFYGSVVFSSWDFQIDCLIASAVRLYFWLVCP
jgi:hypothetical protein